MSQEILATVAGEAITKEDLDAFLQKLPPNQKIYAENPQMRAYYLDQLVSMRLYAALGKEMKLDETEGFRMIMEDVRRELLSQFAMKETLKGIVVTEEEAKEFYDRNPEQFVKGEMVQAKHILVETNEQCSSIAEEIKSGAKTFEEAAKAYSTCPSKDRGGDLGQFGKGQMVKEFEDAAFTAEPGVVVGPVQTQFGYHLIKVESHQEPETIAFADAKEQIEKTVLQQKQKAVYNRKLNELKETYMNA